MKFTAKQVRKKCLFWSRCVPDNGEKVAAPSGGLGLTNTTNQSDHHPHATK